MKHYITSLFFLLLVCLYSCQKSSLKLPNPNSPTPSGSLNSESGIESFALGMYQKWIADVPGEGGSNIMQMVLTNHSILGDEEFVPYGNWGWRWVDQVYAITLPAPYNTKIITPNGVPQVNQLKSTNSRQAGERNSFLYEWEISYFIIGQANQLLSSLSASSIQYTGDADTKEKVLTAWAYWWKGFAYSRIGSMYLSGIINDDNNGTTNGTFVDHTAIIIEANANFEKAIAILQGLTENDSYDAIMTAIIPSFNSNADIITPDMWVRQMYSYEARNYMVNHKVATMTAEDWNTILALANKGLQESDNVFQFGMSPDATNDLSANFFHPFAIHSYGQQFSFISERLIQDFKAGDKRFEKGFYQLDPSLYFVNIRSRGLQFGTRWEANDIEDGGLYATDNSVGTISFACSWDENALMIAEADIRTGNIEGGLQLIDAVRDHQSADLAAVTGTGLTQAQAIEELRRERRVGLYLRGLAFYDARRWGVTAPADQGGGRANAIVMVPGSYIGGTAAQPLPCFMEYNYLDYWDIPQNELDFNVPLDGSAPVAN